MIERLRLVTPSDLYQAIKTGIHSMGVSETKDKQFAGKWAKIIEKLSYKGERLSRDKLTAENVLEWLKADRPDLASLIINMNPEGMQWLREDVKQVYDFLFAETKPQPKPTFTLIKREQPKKEELAPITQPEQQPAQAETVQTQAEPTETAEKT